jgi:hypothetical protein
MNKELQFLSTLCSLQTSCRVDSPTGFGLTTYINGVSSPVYKGEQGGIKGAGVSNLLAKKKFQICNSTKFGS